MAEANKLSTGEVVIAVGASGAVLGSFLPWVDVAFVSRNAWSSDLLFPSFAWPAICGALMATIALVTTFSTAAVGKPGLLGFSWPQVHLILSGVATLTIVSFLIGGESYGAGFWLSFVAVIALVVGATMVSKEAAASSSTSTSASS